MVTFPKQNEVSKAADCSQFSAQTQNCSDSGEGFENRRTEHLQSVVYFHENV